MAKCLRIRCIGQVSQKRCSQLGQQEQKINYKESIVDPRFFRQYLDILSERVTVDPATGQSSDPRQNPGQEAYDIQKQKQQIGLTDPDADVMFPDLAPAAEKWQKQQKSMAYDDRGIPMSVAPVRDKTGVLYDKYKNPISQQGKTSGYRDDSGVDYDAAGNPARKAGVQPKKPNSYY